MYKLLSILFVMYCSMNVHAQRHTTSSEMTKALEKLEVSEKELAEVVMLVAKNDSKIIYKNAQIKFKKALKTYHASIQWITDLKKTAKKTITDIEGAALNDSNKKRAITAISNGIKELNGGLSNDSPTLIDEIGRLIRLNRRDEEIKEMMLKEVEYKNDKVVIDALIDLLIDAKKNKLEGSFGNKMDGQLGKTMKVIKVLKVFDGGKDNMDRLMDLLDLFSDLPPSNLLVLSWYIKAQAHMVDNISEAIGDIELVLFKQNLHKLSEDVLNKDFRIVGDVKNWAVNESILFGKIPPEPSLRLDKSGELPIYRSGTNITVHFEGSFYWKGKGWVGLIPSGTERNSSDASNNVKLQYEPLRSEYGKLSFKAPSKLGLYDIRMFDNDSGIFQSDGHEVASVSIKVIKKKTNLIGHWKSNGNLIRIIQHDSLVLGDYVEVSSTYENYYGHKVDDHDMKGVFDSKTFEGILHMKFPLSYKEKCFGKWEIDGKMELSISKDGNTLQGRRQQFTISDACESKNVGWVNIKYERVIE